MLGAAHLHDAMFLRALRVRVNPDLVLIDGEGSHAATNRLRDDLPDRGGAPQARQPLNSCCAVESAIAARRPDQDQFAFKV